MIESGEIKMPPSKMLSLLFMQNCIPWLGVATAGIIIFVVFGIVIDPRFFIVSLIWIFFIIPIIVAFLYFYYGMMPLTTFNTIPHVLKFSDDKIIIDFIGNEEDVEKKEYIVEKDKFKDVITGADYVVLRFIKTGWIWVPVNAFASYEDFKTGVSTFLPQTA